MSKFNKGDRVLMIDSAKKGYIVDVLQERRGRQLYRVRWDGCESEDDVFEHNISIDSDISDPFKRFLAGIFDPYSEYARRNTTFKIQNSNNSTISSLKASKTIFRPYQFKPLLKFLNSPSRRLLIADEVGLGKTIEAGHIMLELKAQRKLHHVLIVCPKSLREKWKEELANKFGLRFKIYDTNKDLLEDMQQHRFAVRAIVTYEKIRVKESKEDKQNSDNLAHFLSQEDFKFSLVLCDEAHRMRNKNKTYDGAEIILSRTDAAIFLTATPIMIKTENLYNLLHLLDNSRYYNEQIFNNRLEENKPFVEALIQLNNRQPLSIIENQLSNAVISQKFYSNDIEIYSHNPKIGEVFSKDPVYQEIIQLLKAPDTYKNRARLQYLISSMSVMNNIFSRTRKRDVTMDLSQAERRPHTIPVTLNPIERKAFDDVIEEYYNDNSYTNDWGEEKLTRGGSLGLVQKKRQVASSVFAYLSSEDVLNKGIDKYEDFEDAKVEKLVEIINEAFSVGSKKIIIFALFRKTLEYLKIRLKKRGYDALIIHGLIENRVGIINKFKHDEKAQILLSSEVGSEGLDLQFCDSMVNYDLPWNPMVVEQRIGRIDRFGQKSPIVNIYNLIVKDSIQEDIFERLLNRIGIFRGTIGDLETILDREIELSGKKVTIQELYNNLEKELFTTKLTQEEKNRKLKEIEQAIANEQENIERLQQGLDSALTNDAYFKQEIERILHNNSYVTPEELCNYLNQLINKELTTCSLNIVSNGIYELLLPLSKPLTLINFLRSNQPANDEAESSFSRFIEEIRDEVKLRLTFNQERAYEDSSLLFLNIYHPIIQACFEYFSKEENKKQNTFCFALKNDNLLTKGSSFYMGIYRLKVSRKVLGVIKNTDILLPILYDNQTGRVVEDEQLTERVYSQSQVTGAERNPTNNDINEDRIEEMRYELTDAISKKVDERKKELSLLINSECQRNEKQLIEYYNTRIDNHKINIQKWEEHIETLSQNCENKRINELEGAIRLSNSQIQKLEKEKEERLHQLKDEVYLNIDKSLVSLSLISII